MGVLDSILAYKAQKDAQANADINAIPLGIAAFTAAKQVAQKSALDQLGLNVSAASHGLRIGPNGSITRDTSLMSPLEQLLEKGKVAEAAKNMGDRNLFNQVTGLGGASQPQASGVSTTNNALSGIQAPEIDTFTGKPTTAGLQQEAANKAITDKIAKEADIASKQQEKMVLGEGSESGKIALAKESITNIDDVIKTLFPDGTAKSFDRETAFGANMPKLPFGLSPQVRPDNPLDKTDNAKVEKAQNVFRKVGASLSARQLIQTGVAARPEETAKLVSQFGPNWMSNPEASLAGLRELQSFYKDYLNTAAPGRTGKQSASNDLDVLGKLGLDPTKYELVRE